MKTASRLREANMLAACCFYDILYGAEDRTRTDDLLITNQLLYQLSYFGFYSDCTVALAFGKVLRAKVLYGPFRRPSPSRLTRRLALAIQTGS